MELSPFLGHGELFFRSPCPQDGRENVSGFGEKHQPVVRDENKATPANQIMASIGVECQFSLLQANHREPLGKKRVRTGYVVAEIGL